MSKPSRSSKGNTKLNVRPTVWLAIVGTPLLVVAGVWVSTKISDNRAEADFQEQIRLARLDGIPTTAAEFKATISPALSIENAAPFYRRLKSLDAKGADPLKTANALIFKPGPKTLRAAQVLLDEHREYLKVVDQAILRPRCWFDRDWSLGPAVLMPELADMKRAAKFLRLRGSMAVARGDPNAALRDVRGIFRISEHSGEEQTLIADVVKQGIFSIGLQAVGFWALTHRDTPTYGQTLREMAPKFPMPDCKKEHRDDFYGMLWLLEQGSTPEGRKNLGLREQDIPLDIRLSSLFANQPKAKFDIVKAERDYWSAFKLPKKDRDGHQEKDNEIIKNAIVAFPYAATIYQAFYEYDSSVSDRENLSVAYKQIGTGLVWLTDRTKIPWGVLARGLKSPYNGKPFVYTYNDKQRVIMISGSADASGRPIHIKIPPDSVFQP